ncbi:MAG: phage prohead protease, family [Rickettsiales bacterium]|jgi:HK97 family phage prohead protease|nr:phage prohead protease, family [Rickettsiales bacterium]
MIETKQLQCAFALEETAEGSFSGYASVFEVVDSQNDSILSGAFTRTLREKNEGKDIKLLWQHRMDEPVGFITTIYEDYKGLYVEAQLVLESARGKEAYEWLKNGTVRGLSIGYTVASSHNDERKGIRYISDVDLWEISLVTFPANAEAEILHVKAGEQVASVREFEQFLHAQGFSRKQAKRIASSGFPKGREEEIDALGLAIEKGIAVLLD